MNKTKMMLTAAVLGLSMTVGAVVVDKTVATVNGSPILSSDYDKVVAAFEQQYELSQPGITAQPGVKGAIEREVLQKMIEEELLYSAAQKEKTTLKPEEFEVGKLESQATLMGLRLDLVDQAKGPVKSNIKVLDPKTGAEVKDKDLKTRFAALLKEEGLSEKQFEERIRKQMVSRKFVQTTVLSKAAPVSEAAVNELYKDVTAVLEDKKADIEKIKKDKGEAYAQEVGAIAARLRMVTAEQVKLGHIFIAAPSNLSAKELTAKKADADKIKKELDGKKITFTEAVVKYTDDKQALAQTGGDLVLIKGQGPKEIDGPAFSLAVGAVGGPYKTDAGYHIIRIKEKKASEDLVFDKVKNEFAQYLMQQNQQRAVAEYIQSLANLADIKIEKVFSDAPAATPAAAAAPAEAK